MYPPTVTDKVLAYADRISNEINTSFSLEEQNEILVLLKHNLINSRNRLVEESNQKIKELSKANQTLLQSWLSYLSPK